MNAPLVPGSDAAAASWFEPLRLLGTRRFRAFWVGSLLSNIGTWMQNVAEPWLVLSLSGSSILLGLDAFALDAPVLLLTLAGGVLADRRDRRRTILFFQGIQFLCPLALVILLLVGRVEVWMIIALSLVVGITDALSMPAFQAIAPSMVAHDDVRSAVALNSAQFNLSRVLGPAFAGVVMASVGAIGCFSVNALSYLPFLATIAWVVPRGLNGHAPEPVPDGRPWFADLREISARKDLRRALLTVLTTSFFCGPLLAFLPVLVRDVFHADVAHFGGALSAFGVGGLLGAILSLLVVKRVAPARFSSALGALYGLVVIAVALNGTLLTFGVLLVLGGAAMTASNTMANALLQDAAEERIRGQATSLYMLALRGGLSIGNLVAGFAVNAFGVKEALLVNGSLAVAAHALIHVSARGGSYSRSRTSASAERP
jgi:MFS family permease